MERLAKGVMSVSSVEGNMVSLIPVLVNIRLQLWPPIQYLTDDPVLERRLCPANNS